MKNYIFFFILFISYTGFSQNERDSLKDTIPPVLPVSTKKIDGRMIEQQGSWTSITELSRKQVEAIKKMVKTDEVVVTGTRTQVIRSQLPMSLTVINRKEIEESGRTALLPVLSGRVPGLFVTERGVTGFGVADGSAGQTTIRGVGGAPNTQILVLIDGHPQFAGLMGHPLPDAYVSSDVQRVEVIRGPGSMLYGSNAMGGVINIITRGGQSRDGMKTNMQAMYGSYNTQKYELDNAFRKGKFSSFLSLNYDATDGHRPNSDFKIGNGYWKGGYEFNKHLKAYVDVSLAKFKTADPGPDTVTIGAYTTNRHWIDIFRGMVSATFENNYARTHGTITGFTNFGEHKIYDGFRSNDQTSGLIAYQTYNINANNAISAGIDYKNYGGEAHNSSMSFVDTTVNEVAGYVAFQSELFARFSLNAGLRLNYSNMSGSEWVPQVGVAYRLSWLTTLKASVSKGFRNPTIRELYMFMPANADLKAERMMNYELSAIQEIPDWKLNLEAAVYLAKGDNLIQALNTGGVPRYENTGEFTHKGFELSALYRPFSRFQARISYSYLHLDKPLTAAPRNQIFAGLTYNVWKLRFNATARYVDNLYTKTGNSPQTESYALLDLHVNYQVLDWLDVFVNGDNLTNTHYETNAYYPMPGFMLFGGFRISL